MADLKDHFAGGLSKFWRFIGPTGAHYTVLSHKIILFLSPGSKIILNMYDFTVPKPTCHEGKSAKCNETPRTVTTKKCEQIIKKVLLSARSSKYPTQNSKP